jgi:hypothetical protein
VLCEYCHGKGTVLADGGPQPCAECGGTGLLHCCEGLQAQPEADKGRCEQDRPGGAEEGERAEQ